MRTTLPTLPVAAALLALAAAGVSAQSPRLWQGIVVADDDPNDRLEFTITLSAAFRPIVEVETSSGPRVAEIESAGQVFQYVPPGGGVRTVEIEELEAGPDRVYVRIAERFERASNGFLTQSWSRSAQTLVREGEAFHMTFERASGTRLSDLDLAVGGDVETKVYRGLLQPQ